MGPNGSGKSTFSKVLVGHPAYQVEDGAAVFKGDDLLEREPEERAQDGVFLAFHKWRQHRDKEVKAHEMQKIRKERQLLKRELAVLLQRMREMKEVEETTRRTSAQRGVAMMNEVMDQMKLLTAASKKRRVRIDAWVGKEQG